MIDLRGVWLPQIIRYAEMVAGGSVLRSSWIDGDRSQTSVTDYGELAEQFFGDMDVEAQLELATTEFSDDPEIVSLISEFVNGLLNVDRAVVAAGISDQPASIFALSEWSVARERARKLDVYAARRGYPRDFVDDDLTVKSDT